MGRATVAAAAGLLAAAVAFVVCTSLVRGDHAIEKGAAPQAKTPREGTFTGNPVNPPPADPMDAIKHPADWLSWGADLRLRHELLDNGYLRGSDPPGKVWSFERYRARTWATVGTSDLQLNARLTWEGRYWFEPAGREGWDAGEVIWDNLNGRVRLFKDSPVPTTVTVGRQDLMLGDGWLVLEGTPLDGSRSIYFDAARATLDFKRAKTTLDVVYVQQYSDPDMWLPPAAISADDSQAQVEQDERGVILWGCNKSVKDTTVEPYFIYKHDERVLANGDDGDVYTFGGRLTREFSKHWRGKVEGAYQFGHRDNPALFPTSDGDLSAGAVNARVTYLFRDAWDQQVYAGYEYLSGDDRGSGRNEQFDPLWGRWPQWSELYVYTVAGETRIAEISNLHRLNLGWQASPTKKLGVSANYHALFADEPLEGRPGFGGGNFRGNLFTAVLKYTFNARAAGHLWAEYFLPENFYSESGGGAFDTRRDAAAYLRAEVVLTF